MTMTKTIISIASLICASGLIGVFAAHFVSKRREEQKKVAQELEQFREAFLPTIHALTAQDPDHIYMIIKAPFDDQRAAVLRVFPVSRNETNMVLV